MKINKKQIILSSLVGLFAIALVTAGLVTYLSNQAEVSVTVESPFSFEVSIDGTDNSWIGADETTGIATLSLTDSEGNSVQGGESIHFFARDTNLANVPTIGDSSKVITCDTGVTCEDFSSVEAQTTTRIDGVVQTTSQVWEIISLCTEVDENTIEFTYGEVGDPLVVGQSDTTEITVTFQPNTLGDYVFTLQKLA